MLLAIDSGNTNTIFAVFDDEGRIVGDWRSSSNAARTADEFGLWLTQLMGLRSIDTCQVTSAIIATVVPAALFNLRWLCRRYFDCEPLIVGERGVNVGLNVLLDHPEELGADRLVNAFAARERYGGPLIVVDFGTATTFDVVNGEGDYCGGIIAPGVNLSLEALHLAAAKLPRVAIGRPRKVIGANTVEAMKSGIFLGYVSMIEGMVRRVRDEMGGEAKVVATGGLAALFADATNAIEQADLDLTLWGLYIIHRRNRAS